MEGPQKGSRKRTYAVMVGRECGVYDDWEQVKPLVQGFSGAKYRSFPSRGEANSWLSDGCDAVRGGGRAKSRPSYRTCFVSSYPKGNWMYASIRIPHMGVYRSDIGAQPFGEADQNEIAQMCELLGVLDVLHHIKYADDREGDWMVRCSRTHTVRIFKEYVHTWRNISGWTTSRGQPPTHVELIRAIDALTRELEGLGVKLHWGVNEEGDWGGDVKRRRIVHGS